MLENFSQFGFNFDAGSRSLDKTNPSSSRTIGRKRRGFFCRIPHHETIEFSLGRLRHSSFIEQLRRALASTSKHTGIREVCHLVGFLYQMLSMRFSRFRMQRCTVEHAMTGPTKGLQWDLVGDENDCPTRREHEGFGNHLAHDAFVTTCARHHCGDAAFMTIFDFLFHKCKKCQKKLFKHLHGTNNFGLKSLSMNFEIFSSEFYVKCNTTIQHFCSSLFLNF